MPSCTDISKPTVDETGISCNGQEQTTDCVVTQVPFNFFQIGIGNTLTTILTKISDKVKVIYNQLNLNTEAIAAEVARAAISEANLDFAIGVEETSRINADALKANIASPTLTGIPAAPTAAPGTNTTQIATTEFVTTSIATLVADTLTVKVTASSASVIAASTGSGLTLLPAPGVGKFYDILGIHYRLTFATIPFNGTSDGFNIQYSTAARALYTQTGSININYNEFQNLRVNAAATGLDNTTINDAVMFYPAGSITAGDSEITFYITYKIITL